MLNLLKRFIVFFGACIILMGAVFNVSDVSNGTIEGKMHELYAESDLDDGRHIGGEH
ncbi:hypothetical protein [Virgibacillus kimchii]